MGRLIKSLLLGLIAGIIKYNWFPIGFPCTYLAEVLLSAFIGIVFVLVALFFIKK